MNSNNTQTYPPSPAEAWGITLILGLMGAFFWAIRGTGGFGGLGGAILAGLGWAMLWYAFSHLDGRAQFRPYGTLKPIAAITFGIGLGGMTGYGVYIGWVQGQFYLNYPEEVRAIAPWTGYLALLFCGLHWGGNAGAFLAWCAPNRPLSGRDWAARIGAGVGGAVLAYLLTQSLPQAFLPFYGEGIYGNPDFEEARRAMGSVANIAPHVGLFLGFLAFECYRRDWRAVKVMGILAGSFALAFSMGGYWHTFNSTGHAIDWWKNWEMTIGLAGGLAFGLVFVLFNAPLRGIRPHAPSEKERVWSGAVPIGLVTLAIVSDAWEGFVNLHDLTWPAEYRTMTVLLYGVPLVIALVLWYRSGETDLPAWAPAAVIALIVVAGFVVSIPPAARPASSLLLTLYTGYILISGALFGLLLWPTRDGAA